MNKSQQLASKLFIPTLWLIPFYLPIVVFAASTFGSIYVFSAWKELVMAVLLLLLVKPTLNLLQAKDKTVRLLNISIVAYVLLAIPYVIGADSLFEFGAGFLFSTRFLLFFLIAQVLAAWHKNLPGKIVRITVIAGAVLASFAVLQALILPPTFLQHIGYEPLGVETPGFPPAVTTLGDINDFIRPQATLRGPNPLGAFLLLPFCYLILLLVNGRRDKKILGVLVLLGIAMLFTFSRSAWMAAFIGTVGISLYIFRQQIKNINRLYLLIAMTVVILSALLALNNKTVRVIVLREETNSSTRLSDDIRSSLTREAWSDVASNPLGRGPGNAGPVSVLDNDDRGRIAENYFLQVAQETGWLGLGLFAIIHILLLKALWQIRNNNLALIGFFTLIGLIAANFTLHTWADDAVSILWWSFAGAIIGAYIKGNGAGDVENSN